MFVSRKRTICVVFIRMIFKYIKGYTVQKSSFMNGSLQMKVSKTMDTFSIVNLVENRSRQIIVFGLMFSFYTR